MPTPEPVPTLTDAQRDAFDALLQDAIQALPRDVRDLMEHVPVVVLDEPTDEIITSLRRDGTISRDDDGLDLCGLHTGVALTERSIEDPTGWGTAGLPGEDGSGGPETVHLFRRGICALAGGWNQPHAEEHVYEEIRITLLHEYGHHFGLDENDLDDLGYA